MLALAFATLAINAQAQIQFGAIPFQHPTGEIRVEVKDPSGAPLEATGKLESQLLGVDRLFQTDAQGKYIFGHLSDGRYRLVVSKDGFATQSQLIDVRSGTPMLLAVTMELSSLAFKVDVIAPTPLPGLELEPNEIAAPVQAASQRDLERSGGVDLSDFLNRRFSGVHVNEIQGNPYQPDVNYRGYTASPLLGTPQGLSVYMDGVRLNQPFGDVVSWDLIPRVAISETTLMPGSNPLFGLNTLGGALSIHTKDGRSQPGTSVQISGGSFGRLTTELEHGGANDKGLNWYLAGNLFFEEGWRDHSPTNVRQFFSKLSWQRAKTSLGLTAAYANNSLTGNGLQEQRFFERDYASVYTIPDITDNRSPLINLTVRHIPNAALMFSGNAYYRYIGTKTLNGDLNEDSLDQSLYQPDEEEQAALVAAGYTGFPTSGANAGNTPFPFWRCIGQVLLRDEPAEKCNGLVNRASARQHNYGLSGQLTWFASPRGHRNLLTVGGAFDGNNVIFSQSSQLGYLNPDRSITGVNAFGDGVTGGEADGEPYDTRIDLNGRIHTGSVFVTDTLSIGSALNISLSGRHNRTIIENSDRLNPGGGPGSLDGRHIFDRFNPAAGITFSPWRGGNLYLSYTEGSRAPTSIELGCADPEQPCKLPNAMAGDPPLDQVVTRTWEAGLRGGKEGKLKWNLSWFRANNRQDILFVASQQTGFGHFKNFGKTRRQGLEVGLNTRIWRVNLNGSYTFLDATFRSPETVNGESNSSNNEADEAKGLEGAIQIDPGARIPLIPQHMFKAFADFQAASKMSIYLSIAAFSSSYARGNENNLHEPDGEYYLGAGRSPGYAIANLGANYRLHRRLQLFVQINNLFNKRYFSAAQLGPTAFTGEGAFIARPFPAVDGEFPLQRATFYAPGAPRAAWGGFKFTF